MTIGPVTYQYAGQVKYSYAPEPPGPTVVVEPSGWVDHAPRAVILSGMHNDALGRRWNPVDVDDALLLASVQDWEVEHGIDWGPTTSLPASDLVYEQGDTYQFEWTSYRRPECTSGVDLPPYWIFDSDARTAASSFNPGTWLEWQRQVVYVQWRQESVPTSGSSCHGTMVHPEWVLTAAHCVWDRIADEPVDTSNPDILVRVYTHGGDLMAAALERTVTEIHPGPFRAGWAPHRDYALVRLNAPLSHTGYMRLSADTEAQVRDQYMIHASTFPAHSNIPWVNGPTTCTDNSGANPIGDRDKWWSAKPGWETLSELTSVTRSKVRTVFNV